MLIVSKSLGRALASSGSLSATFSRSAMELRQSSRLLTTLSVCATNRYPKAQQRPVPPPAVFNRRSIHHVTRRMRSSATRLATADNAIIRMDPPRIHISREMLVEDTQMFGLVHGCTQLQLVEDAGTTLTTEYCNSPLRRPDDELPPKDEIRTLSGCLEEAHFIRPMLAGDVAEVEAEITYTSGSSMQVTASVYAKNKDDGSRYKTVETKMWFIAKQVKESSPTASLVPPLKSAPRPGSEDSYRTLKTVLGKYAPNVYNRPYQPDPLLPYNMRPEDVQPFTPDFSRCRLILPIHPAQLVPGEKYCCGGVILRQMDEAGDLAAVGHCNHYSFTSNFSWVIFHRKINVGSVMVTTAEVIFASSKQLEVAVRVEEQWLEHGVRMNTARAVDGVLTFMSVDPDTGKTRPMPPIKVNTEEQRKLFEERKALYEQRKLARQNASS